MARADNSGLLVEAGRRRSKAARQRALEAVATLVGAGEAVTPTAVARRAGVSRQWLYTFEEARAAIEAAQRRQTPPSSPPPSQRASTTSLQRRLEALTDDNQRLRRRVQELEDRLAAVYGEWRLQRGGR